MRARNAATALLLAGISVFTAGSAAQAFAPTPGSAGGENCSYRLVSVKTVRLQENRGDEVRIVIGGRIFPTTIPRNVKATVQGQVLNASAFGSPTEAFNGAITVEMVEVDPLRNDRVGLRTETCTPGVRTDIYEGSEARYDVTSEIIVG